MYHIMLLGGGSFTVSCSGSAVVTKTHFTFVAA